ncbi:MAG: alkyl/aryl-sulfatase [Pseudomonas sp.]
MTTVLKAVATLALLTLGNSAVFAAPAPSKPASEATKAANAEVLKALPFSDKTDFEDAARGFIAKPDTLTILSAAGTPVWDLESYKQYISLDKATPDTINPSLYRNAQLSMQYGLFKVTDRIYQVRGYDLSNITFVQGDTGWIVFDPLISTETAKAAYDLVTANLGQRPVVALVYSHSHIDHYGGGRGLGSDQDFASGKIKVFAPDGFSEHAISENVIAGNAMSRRAIYMYGAMLPRNAQGGVNGGLGQTTSTGTTTLVLPTDLITKTGEVVTVDGVQMEFQMTPGTEAPAEMNTWFPQFKAMWMAENSTNTMHNILTLRGAQVRDALKWASFLNETIERYGDKVEVKFQSHHWPQWGQAKIDDYWKKQRDLYKYTHDQSVNLMNKGYNGEEISEMIKLPPELDQFWPNRGYYGTLRHNSRAVYQRYMGWYDGNPSDLNNLPPEDAAKKYVAYMGGEAAVLKLARADFDKGEYRWVAEVLKHVVFANPNSTAGKDLLADTYEQLGYQAESGPWRGVYLQGAYELRNGVPSAGGINTAGPDVIKAMPPEMLFDYLAVRLNGPNAAGKKIFLNIDFTDLKKEYGLSVENAVLNYGKPLAKPDVTLTLSKATLDAIQLKQTTLENAIAKGDLKVDGKREALTEFLGLLDVFPFWFNIVTP